MSVIRSRMLPIAVCLAFGLAACGGGSTKSTDDVATVTDGGNDRNYGSPATDSSVDDTVTSVSNSVDGDGGLKVETEGDFLVDTDGITLYIFNNDTQGTSTCNSGCSGTWPAFVLPDGEVVVADDALVATDFTTIVRDDGPTQVVYKGQPLYYYVGDSAPGDANGDGIGGVWFRAEQV